jgi:hypothetical protein
MNYRCFNHCLFRWYVTKINYFPIQLLQIQRDCCKILEFHKYVIVQTKTILYFAGSRNFATAPFIMIHYEIKLCFYCPTQFGTTRTTIGITFLCGWSNRFRSYLTIDAFSKKSLKRFFNKTIFS